MRGSILDLDCDAGVSPTKRCGSMDGDIDLICSERFGWHMMIGATVQGACVEPPQLLGFSGDPRSGLRPTAGCAGIRRKRLRTATLRPSSSASRSPLVGWFVT